MAGLQVPRAVPMKVPRALAAALVVGIMAAVGAFAGVYAPEWTGSALQEAQTRAVALDREVAANDARAAVLEQRVEQLNAQVIERDRIIVQLESTLGESGPLSERYVEMASQYASLRAEHLGLQDRYQGLEMQMESLVRIRTPELPGDALLLDRSVKGIRYTGAVCSGSMEPNITCNDLLLMYEPRISDLDVGDIIYYRRQNSDCDGATENRYILHRISRVVLRSDGLHFETRGDALSRSDQCLVPADDVLYKLLTNVRNARIQS